MNFETTGKETGKIPIHIHYRILELFSAGLYSSPNKAFEELICNSYDAGANKVAVYVPSNIKADSVLWVCDNGESMDSNGLKLLWKIGYSERRDNQKTNRQPIGKFGIGKLATFVLAKKLTYICKSGDEFKAVTMDYSKINPEVESGEKQSLTERTLTESQVIEVLKPLLDVDKKKLISFDLWGKNAESSWTFAIMSDLKEKAWQIKEGRLRWIISTALPLSPNFNLFFNGRVLESSKIDIPLLKKWIIGKNDKVAEKKNYPTSIIDGVPCVNLPNIKNIHGQINLYEDSLVRGRSQDVGRSNGIFLMIRGRLINDDNPLIGSIEELNHAAFNRMQIIIHADELDDYLTSTRESIISCSAFSDIQKYIKQKFYEAKLYLEKYFVEKSNVKSALHKVAYTSTRLSRRPLISVTKKFFNKEIDNLFLTQIPENLNKKEQEAFIDKLEVDLLSNEGIIKNISIDALAPEDPIAKFNLETREIKVNLMHPFFANFSSELRSNLFFELIATTEVLTEALLLECGIKQDIAQMIMEQRDLLFRELTYNSNPNAPYVVQMIRSALTDPSELEDAIFFGFKSLGFRTTKIGGKGEPDGKAVAIMGVSPKTRKREDYAITYDAKSTKKERIKAETIKTSACVRHRTKYKANYSVVVAIDFEGADNPKSACSIEAKQQKVTLIKASDFWRLVLMAIPNQLNYSDYKEFFDNCHTVIETNKWVNNLKERPLRKRPIKELLDTTAELMKKDTEPPNIHAIRAKNTELEKYTIPELKMLIKTLENLIPRLISIDDRGNVSIYTTPEMILKAINSVIEKMPNEYIDLFIKAFESKN